MSRILVIEDEEDIQEILRNYLTAEGYSVTLAGDGVEGITKFHDGSWDLILLDVLLPKINGFGVCELIRRESDVPIVMLTALEQEEYQIRGLDLRADDYITKPFAVSLISGGESATAVTVVAYEIEEDEQGGIIKVLMLSGAADLLDTTGNSAIRHYAVEIGETDYTMFVSGGMQPVNQAMEILYQMFPYILLASVVVATLFAAAASLYLTAPMVRLSHTAQRMAALDLYDGHAVSLW